MKHVHMQHLQANSQQNASIVQLVDMSNFSILCLDVHKPNLWKFVAQYHLTLLLYNNNTMPNLKHWQGLNKTVRMKA